MAVKCAMKIVPRFYSHKERKSDYFLRNSSFNLSRNSPPKVTSKYLSSSPNMIKDSAKNKSKELVSKNGQKREYNLRNSSFNLSYCSHLKRSTRNLEFTPNVEVEHSMKNKVKKLVCTQGKIKENSLRNSHSSVNHSSRQKRKANCVEHTPNTKTEHPMKKKLRELAFISTPKNTIATNQDLTIDKDFNGCVSNHNKRKVTRSISMKSLDLDNALQSSKKSAPCRMRSMCKTTVVLEKCNETSKIKKATNSSDSKGIGSVAKKKYNLRSQPAKLSNSVKPVLKELLVRVIPLQEDILVKTKCTIDAKGEAKTFKVKSSLKTPVIKQKFSRNLRSKEVHNDSIIVSGYSPKDSTGNPVTNNFICDLQDSLKANCLDSLTSIKKKSCDGEYLLKKKMVAVPKRRGRQKKSVSKTSTEEEGEYLPEKIEIAAKPKKRGRKKKSVSKTSTYEEVEYLPKKIEIATVPQKRGRKNKYISQTSTDAKHIEELEGNKDSSVKTNTKKKEGTNTVEREGKEQVEFQRNIRKVFEKTFESRVEKRITRSSTFANKYEELSPFDNFPKESKRHTFPNLNKSSKSKNPLRVYSVGHLGNVPLDVLTKPSTSFHESQVHTPKTAFVSLKKEAPKASLKAKIGTPIKSVSKISLKGKKTEVELPKKTSGPTKKVPAVGTLRRKRWIMKTLKEKSQGHEDDIFENRKIELPKMFSDDESDATDFSIATPVCRFLVTPNVSRRSPQYRPCISSNDLTAARKVAEEYLYRRNKSWKQACKNFQEKKAVTSENQGLDKTTEYSKALADVLKAQADIEKLTQEKSDEEDEYFSDV